MLTNSLSSVLTAPVAIAAGIAGLLGLVFIILFFTVGRPFGTLNDIFIGLTAILSAVLVWLLLPSFSAAPRFLAQALVVVALLGSLVVVVGSVLVISRITGWYLAGLYMAAGNASVQPQTSKSNFPGFPIFRGRKDREAGANQSAYFPKTNHPTRMHQIG